MTLHLNRVELYIRNKRRLLTQLILVNCLLVVVQLLTLLFISGLMAFGIFLVVLTYNYFLTRFVVSLPSGIVKLRKDGHLIIPLLLSVAISCLISIYTISFGL